jgi:preprotein translocase subunit SecG
MQALILILHILASIAIIILVLMQHGKGADAGAAFGSGASNTMFGSAGAMSFFMKLTVLFAAIFFATSLTLSYLASHQQRGPIIGDLMPPAVTEPAPESSQSAPLPSTPTTTSTK